MIYYLPLQIILMEHLHYWWLPWLLWCHENMMFDVTSSTNLETASGYHFYQIKNRNTVSISLYTDGHVIAIQPFGK